MIASSIRLRLALAVLVTLLMKSATAQADLRFTEARADVGEVKSGAPLVHEYTFTNSGAETVEIEEVRVSCGCLKPELESRSYKPGESGKLRIEVNTLTQGIGPHAWRTTVRYRRGGETCEQELLLSATVAAEITVEPPELAISADRGITHELRLIDRRARPLTITSVQTTSPKLTAKVTAETRDAQGQLSRTIRLDVALDFPEGRHAEMLNIYTDDPLYCHLKVPVTITKRSRHRFTVVPDAVTLTALPGQPIPSKIVLIRAADGGSVEIERTTPSDPAIGCTWARGPGSNATLRVTVDRARLQGGGLRGNVKVNFATPAMDTVTIPVTVTTP
jgi:hypothetical protein